MTNQRNIGDTIFQENESLRCRAKFGTLLYSDPSISTNENQNNNYSHRNSNASAPSPWSGDMSPNNTSGNSSPFSMSPFNNSSPYINSPWTQAKSATPLNYVTYPHHGLIGSLVREEGHIYSLAASGDLLFTGSDSKNIRVWKNLKEFSGFKSNSGLVKAIVLSGNRIFTGHQDGKIRVWRFLSKNHSSYKRIGNLPTTFDYMRSSINPKSYVEVRRRRPVPWIRHYDAVSCMGLDEQQGLLYSGSWDKTFKVWRLSDSKCVESVIAHDDAINSVVVDSGLVFTGSADGSVKVWRKELVGSTTTHVLVQIMLKQDSSVTSLAVNAVAGVVYAGSSDGLVNYCEREKHFLTHSGVLRGHKMAVLCLANAGSLVMSGSADKSICVWRREVGGDHTCLSVLTGHTGPVKCLAVEEDQYHDDDDNDDDDDDNQRWILYSGSLDKSVKVWRVSNHAPDLKYDEISTD